MSIFSAVKNRIAKYSKDPDLLDAPDIENNSIESAANLVQSASNMQARTDDFSASMFGKAIEKTNNTVQNIENIKFNIDQYKTTEAVKNIHNLLGSARQQIDNAPALLANNPKDKNGNPYSAIDLNDHALSSVSGSINGMIGAIGKSLPKESTDYLKQYAEQQIGKLQQYTLARQQQFSHARQVGVLKGGFPDQVKAIQVGLLYKDTRPAALKQTHKLVENIESLARQAKTPAELESLTEMAAKVAHYPEFSKSIDDINSGGIPATVTANYLSSGASSQQKSVTDSTLMGMNPKNLILAAGGNYIKNAYAAKGAAEALSKIRSSKDVRSSAEQMSMDTENSSNQHAGKFFLSMINHKEGDKLAEILDESAIKAFQTIKDSQVDMTTAKENSDSDGYVKAATRHADALNKVLSIAHSHNIPLESIQGIQPEESQSIDNLVYGSTMHDDHGNITSINLSTYNDNDINILTKGIINRHGQTVVGDTPEARASKYLRYLPPGVLQNMDPQDKMLNSISFQPKIQQYANKLDVYKGDDGKNIISNVSNMNDLSRKIRLSGYFHLNQTSVMTGIPIDALSKQIATQITLIAGNDINNRQTIKQAYDHVKTQSDNMASLFHVYSGHTNGVGYTIDPATSQSYFPGVENESHIGELATQGAHAAYDRYIRGLSVHHPYNTGKNKLEVLTEKGLQKKITEVVKDTGYKFSDWQEVSQNGALYLLSPDGKKIAITHADIHTGIQKYGDPEKIKSMLYYASHIGEMLLDERKRLSAK